MWRSCLITPLSSRYRAERAAQLVRKIGSNVNLALVARGLGFDHGLGALSADHKSQDTDGILATLIRAILGSIYWDSRNEQAVRRAMIRMGVFDECAEVDRAGQQAQLL